MIADDVIPPSPPVKLNKSRSKCNNGQRPKKRKRRILSLRAKNRELLSKNIDNIPPMTSSGESIEKNPSPQLDNVNIYIGLNDAAPHKQSQIESVLKDFDIFGHSRQIENGNDCGLFQPLVRLPVSNAFSQAHGLVSLKEFISTQNSDSSDRQPQELVAHLPIVRNSIENEAKEVSLDNIQFSEWPLPDQCARLSPNQQPSFPESSPNSSNVPSIVQSILNDFSDYGLTQDEIAHTPPAILIRRPQQKTYKRTQIATSKTLVFQEDEGQSSADEYGSDDGNATQCSQAIDIDLNSSRRIVENLARLSTFFTQPQSYELDFNTDLSHTIPNFEKRFDEFVPDSDDSESIKTFVNFEADTVDTSIEAESNAKNDFNIESFNSGDEIFWNVETPKGELRHKNVKRNPVEVSTPVSSRKVRIDDAEMHDTPSTSKAAISNEQLIPKRLCFGSDAPMKNCDESPSVFRPLGKMTAGFSTARGKCIPMSTTGAKRTAGIFANIDIDYKHIDPVSSDTPNPKRTKLNENKAIQGTSRIDDTNPMTSKSTESLEGFNQPKCDGFRTVRGANWKMSATAASKARNIFGEDLSNLSKNQPVPKFQSVPQFQPVPQFLPSNQPGPSNMSANKNGFTTAAGSNIKISSENLQKYRQALDDVDQSVRDEFGIKEDSTLTEHAFACKTPLNKLAQRQKIFATSTPNPSAMGSLKNCSPITPINQETLAHNEFTSWFDELDGKTLDEIFATQNLNETAHKSNTSSNLNDTISSDFQLLNETITDQECDVLNVAEEVKNERQKAFCEQQSDCFKKPHSVRPLLGWLVVQKILSSKKLHDLGKPKKCERDELERLGVQSDVIELTVDNALHFKFDMWKFYSQDVCLTNVEGIDVHDDMKIIMDANSRVGVKELTSAFLQCPYVDPKLIPDHWIKNCLKWIMVKLASYERAFPSEFSGICLTPENVLSQLKYRYDREIDKAKRSAIRKIVEKDDTAAKRMVLFVSRILKHNLAYSFELCDGWYSIRTSSLDSVLSNAITSGKITIGTKLVIQGAELVGIEGGCSPLEMPSSGALKISGNSTRRGRWHAKLGYCKDSWPFTVSLNSINCSGGLITRTRAYVLRVYPLVFLAKEMTENGQKTVFRSNKMEQRQEKKDDKKQFEIVEKFYSDASEKIEKDYEIHRKKYQSPRKKLCDIDDAEELWNFMEYSNDGVSFETDLSTTQKKLLSDYQTKFYDEKQSKIAAIVKEKLSDIENPKKATPLQKVRLIDTIAPNVTKTAILAIWRANESHATLRENTFLDIRCVNANGMRGKDMQLSAGNFTVLREIQSKPSTIHAPYIRKLTPLMDIDPQQFKPHFNEFDTLGYVLEVEDSMPNAYQSVFIVDAWKNLLCIKFWGSIQQYAYDDIVQARKFLVISNLDWRPQNRVNHNGIPHAFVMEITTFSEIPRSTERAAALDRLRDEFDQLNLTEYEKICCEKMRSNGQANKENSKLIITPQPLDSSMNQSTASTSSAGNRSVLGVQQRIARLRNVGTPPAFRGSYLGSKLQTSHRKPFKPPTIRQESSTNP